MRRHDGTTRLSISQYHFFLELERLCRVMVLSFQGFWFGRSHPEKKKKIHITSPYNGLCPQSPNKDRFLSWKCWLCFVCYMIFSFALIFSPVLIFSCRESVSLAMAPMRIAPRFDPWPVWQGFPLLHERWTSDKSWLELAEKRRIQTGAVDKKLQNISDNSDKAWHGYHGAVAWSIQSPSRSWYV